MKSNTTYIFSVVIGIMFLLITPAMSMNTDLRTVDKDEDKKNNEHVEELEVARIMDEPFNVLKNVWNNWNVYNNRSEDNKLAENIVDIRNIDTSAQPQIIIVKIIKRYAFVTGNHFYLVESQGENLIIEENKDLYSMANKGLADVANISSVPLEAGKEYLVAITVLKNPKISFDGPYPYYNDLVKTSPEEANEILKKRFFTGLNLFDGKAYFIGKYIYD